MKDPFVTALIQSATADIFMNAFPKMAALASELELDEKQAERLSAVCAEIVNHAITRSGAMQREVIDHVLQTEIERNK